MSADAVLLITMPETCSGCPLSVRTNIDSELCCCVGDVPIEHEKEVSAVRNAIQKGERPEWCPLLDFDKMAQAIADTTLSLYLTQLLEHMTGLKDAMTGKRKTEGSK